MWSITQIKSSNRTFMELKFRDEVDNYKRLQGSNRTFMELKFAKNLAFFRWFLVLIVPLWN